MRFHCITLPLMRSILNVNVILADNMNIFSMLAKKKWMSNLGLCNTIIKRKQLLSGAHISNPQA